MPTVQYSDGTNISFQGNPTSQDIEEAHNQTKGIGEQTQESQTFQSEWDKISQQAISNNTEPQSFIAPRSLVADIGVGLERGIIRGSQAILNTGINAYELSSKLFGGHPSNAPKEWLKENENEWNKILPSSGTFAESLATGIGELPAAIGTFMNPVTKGIGAVKLAFALGAINGQEDGGMGMLTSGLSSATQMALLGKAQTLKAIPGALLGSSAMAIPTYLAGGTPQEVAAAGTLGAGFALSKPTTIKETTEFVSQARDFVTNPKERFEMFKDAVTKDPINDVNSKINDELRKVSSKEVGLTTQEKEAIATVKKQYQTKSEINTQVLKDLLSEEDLKNVNNQNRIKLDIQIASKNLEDKIDIFNKNIIPEEGFNQASYVQKILPEFNRNIDTIYGKQYDKVANSIDTKEPISYERVRQILTNSAEKIVNSTADENDPILIRIHKLLEGKYSEDPIIGTDRSGRQVKLSNIEGRGNSTIPPGRVEFLQQTEPELYQSYLKSREQNIPFAEAHADLKRIWNSVPLGSHSAATLRHTFGDFIAEKVPEFQKLQDSYKPVLDYRARLNKIFQPYKTEANLEEGTNFLKQFALGKESPVDRRILDFLQYGRVEGKPTEFTSGVGDTFMQKLNNFGVKLNKMQEQFTKVGDEKSARLTALAQEFGARVSALREKGALTEKMLDLEKERAIDNLQLETARQRMEFELRKHTLKGRQQKLADIKAERESHEGLYRSLSLFIGSVWSYRITRAMQGLLVGGRALRKVRGR